MPPSARSAPTAAFLATPAVEAGPSTGPATSLRYTLPDLDFDYGALEPHISGRIMELHHGKHHAAYVEHANQTIMQLAEARESGDDSHLAELEHALAFNLSGHLLHSILWKNLTPAGDERPEGALASAIDANFGSFERFRKQLTGAASTIMGSGWGALVWDPLGERLLTMQIHDHQSGLGAGCTPLMVIDAWEHAYYLQYQDQKAAFFEAVWQVWNWKDISARFISARRHFPPA